MLIAGDRAYIATGPQRKLGAVYVFKRAGDTWAAETTLTQSDTMPNSMYGSALAASGNRLMVGSSRADSGTGAVYVYSRNRRRRLEDGDPYPAARSDHRQEQRHSARRCCCAATPR